MTQNDGNNFPQIDQHEETVAETAGEKAVRGAIDRATIVASPGSVAHDGDSKPIDEINVNLASVERNDLGNARRLMSRHGQDLKYILDVGWHYWDGRRWCREGADHAVKLLAHQTAQSIVEEAHAIKKRGPIGNQRPHEVDDIAERLMRWSVASGNRGRIDAMLTEAAPYSATELGDMDQSPSLLNLGNGTLKLVGSCEILRPHGRNDNITKLANVDFEFDAECPQWNAFLRSVIPSPEIRLFLQTFCGYALTGHTSEQVLLFFYGGGANGKSVFIDTVARIMGSYAASVPFASLIRNDRQNGADATPDIARLPGVRLVRTSEPEQNARLAEAKIKALTGGEEFTARHLRKGFFDFVPSFKIIFSGNHRPLIRGGDDGIWRRLYLVPWEVKIPSDSQDPQLKEKLWTERAGILQWMLDGTRMWLEKGLDVPATIRAATDIYRDDSNPVGRFVIDCIDQVEGESVQVTDMYRAYQAWCEATGERAWGSRAFGTELTEVHGIKRFRSKQRTYLGVQLRSDRPGNTNEQQTPHPADEESGD